MRWLFFVAVLLTARLEAADFRMSDFGEPCTSIAEREAALGGEPIPWKAGNADTPAFKAKLFGRDVSIVYLCKSGALLIGNYFFPKQTRESAVETLRAVYEDLVTTYGVPFLDSSPWQYGEASVDLRAIYKPSYYDSVADTRAVNAGLVRDGDEAGPNWAVMVVFHGADLTKDPAKRPDTGVADP